MEIKSDIPLKGTAWNTAISNLSEIFATRTNYSLFMLCLSIGVMYDKRIESPEENGEETRSVPRNVISNNDNGKLDFCFQAAILSTLTEKITEEQRLELAFGEKSDFNKVSFLLSFANFGAEKLASLVGDTPLESMDNIKNFMVSTVEGRNLEIDALPIDELDIFDE
ncbi:MAG: hypothetical protein SOX68_10715 [Faecalicoccus sp.]|uniref:hypothetical protein n=1 Tax=Faecalicoccus sp. TaxID=1971758 RepID=UPI002A7F602B|nr:hypothetical protein [Faecalicoccus sp.]MCI7179833.1 hypothetical protein [Lachnospiraceae bacterium]MDY4279415.1 hypothetical protein [Faecalicoccus sp.]MDY4670437.1 hypothetical protein [Oliverpabstia sp.]MDY5620735.1 hypothetical protein [Lachnospiraceae bacterium]